MRGSTKPSSVAASFSRSRRTVARPVARLGAACSVVAILGLVGGLGLSSASAAQVAQTVSITSAAPAGVTGGGPAYTVTATATSGLPVTLSIDPSATSVCSISGNVVEFIGAGTCTIDANQAGSPNYSAATQVQQSFAVGPGFEIVLFNSAVPTAATVDGSYRVAASTGSGLTVSLAVASGSQGVCALSGVGVAGGITAGTVKFTGVGTCTITASQPGNSTFQPATTVTQSFEIVKASAKAKAKPKLKPEGVTVTVKHEKTKLVVSGKLQLPKGITAAEGYKGTITITAVKGKKTLSKATGKLSAKTGKYSITLAHASAATSLTVTFGGNAVLKPLTAKHKLGS
jgi:hypothetical protein